MTLSLVGQLALFLTEACLIAGVLLLLFHGRRFIGLTPLYITLGAFQHLQVVLALSVYVEITDGLLIGPGSAILFTSSLFAVLLVYVREDALEARKLIYGLVLANATLSGISYLFGLHLREPFGRNLLGMPVEVFTQNPRVLMVGTVALLIDVILLIVVYEATRVLQRWFMIRVFVSMVTIMAVDSVLFVFGSFWGAPGVFQILGSSFTGKVLGVLIYTPILAFYLARVEPRAAQSSATKFAGSDVFHFLTYRERYQELLETAQRDPLTGVFNRGFFDETLPLELHRAARNGSELALLLIDIDHFKSINDRYGHQMGDSVLRCFACQLEARVRASDIACRFGGEEFAVILPESPIEKAAEIAESLRQNARDSCKGMSLGCPVEFEVTATAGVAIFPADGTSAEELIRVADSRLYQGKRAGRNRVVAS